jgi:hypothetical protein
MLDPKLRLLWQGLVAVGAAAAVALHAPTQLRAALGLPLFFGIGFVDSSMCGLCTESMVRNSIIKHHGRLRC